MDSTYTAYRTALDEGALTEAMALEARFYREEERKERWTVIGITALWAVAAFIPTYLFTMVAA